GGARGFVGPFGAVADADLSGRQIDDGRWNKERRDLARAAVEQSRMLPFDHVKTANAGADMHAHTRRVLRRDFQTGHFDRLIRGRQRQMDEAPHLLYLFFLYKIQGIETFDFGSDLAGKIAGIEGGDFGNAALAGNNILPDFGAG